MARRGRRAAQRGVREIILGTLAFGAAIAAIAALVYYLTSAPRGLNQTTLCPADEPAGHFVLLVDRTDSLTFTQRQALSVILRELVEKRTPEGYLLSVFILGEDFEANAQPLIELCNPGSGAGKSELTANLRKLRRQYEEKFVLPLTKQLEAMVSSQPAKYSPIFEMLQLVGINAFRKHDVKGERRLIIVSDMLHNTLQFSMYRGTADYEAFAVSSYGRKAQAELPSVEVEVHYLINAPQIQTKRNLKFWEAYFNKAGARVVDVRPLEG